MKRNVLLTALAAIGLLMVLWLSACQKAAPPTNLAGSSAAASPTPEKFDAAAIEAELIKLERAWADAVKNGDADTVRRVMADDIVIINPDGANPTKAEEVRSIQERLLTIESWEILEPKVVVLDANNAFVSGRGVIKNGKAKVPNSKRTIDISGEYRFLDVYARRNGTWQAVASQTTKIETQ
ncbi:MAG TPA: nuclear transport factor 2 family protein [Pyrinomonadaceae bacterium]|nr:nuclear transport factor 2 family protein [Pyrinomonadaceae bacterium]